MEYDVFFDESGDLGWKFDAPYRKNGSSRYFIIAYIIIPTSETKYLSRFIKEFHKDRGGQNKEIKGADIRNPRAKVTARKMVAFLEKGSNTRIGVVTVKKSDVPKLLVGTRNDDVLYNHMVKKGLCPELIDLKKVNIIPDKKSVPKGSQNSCSDLLKDELWLCQNSKVDISYQPEESHNIDGLMFIDWVANFIWRHYEDGHSEAYQILDRHINETKLDFQ